MNLTKRSSILRYSDFSLFCLPDFHHILITSNHFWKTRKYTQCSISYRELDSFEKSSWSFFFSFWLPQLPIWQIKQNYKCRQRPPYKYMWGLFGVPGVERVCKNSLTRLWRDSCAEILRVNSFSSFESWSSISTISSSLPHMMATLQLSKVVGCLMRKLSSCAFLMFACSSSEGVTWWGLGCGLRRPEGPWEVVYYHEDVILSWKVTGKQYNSINNYKRN